MKHFKKLALLGLVAWFSSCEAPQGDPGQKGATGAAGSIGPAGANGPIGLKGETGTVGPGGDTGPKGAVGATGTLTSFSTGWLPTNWTIESETFNSSTKNFVFATEINDPRITENTINNGINSLYIKSNIKFAETKLFYRIESYYRSISNSGLNAKYSLVNGKVLLKISTSFSSAQAAALRDSLNKDNILFKFQSIN